MSSSFKPITEPEIGSSETLYLISKKGLQVGCSLPYLVNIEYKESL